MTNEQRLCNCTKFGGTHSTYCPVAKLRQKPTPGVVSVDSYKATHSKPDRSPLAASDD